MQLDEFMLHLDQFHEEFNIDTSPEGRINKLTREMLELISAHEKGPKEEADEESIDVLICALSNVTARGIKNPLFACFQKLQKTAQKYREGAKTVYHIHPCYPWHCGATTGIMTTDERNVDCPACLAGKGEI